MSQDAFHERGKALEDHFFKERDKQLLQQLKQQVQSSGERETLAQVSGISDPVVLDELLLHQITAESLLAISLVPLVAVAWADNKMERGEVEAILKAAAQVGIQPDQPAYALIQNWLHEKPADDLFKTWADYIRSLRNVMDAASFAQLRSSVLDRATRVAESAGGFLGLGNKISAVERRVLDDLQAVFDGAGR